MRTVLIPTDFTVESLIAIKNTLQKSDKKPINVILFHSVALSDSITDLLMFSKPRFIREHSSQAFMDACEIMKHKFSSDLNELKIELFTGNTTRSFLNFLDANEVDEICYMEELKYAKPSKYSRDSISFIKKAQIKITALNQKIPHIPASENQLAILLTESV